MTYTTGWEPWIVARDGDSGLDFAVRCRGAVRDHRVRTGQPSLTLVPRKLRQRRGEVVAIVCAPVAYAVQFAGGQEQEPDHTIGWRWLRRLLDQTHEIVILFRLSPDPDPQPVVLPPAKRRPPTWVEWSPDHGGPWPFFGVVRMCQSISPVSLDAGEDTNRSSRRPTAKLSRSAGGRPWGYCAQHLPDDLIAARTQRRRGCRL